MLMDVDADADDAADVDVDADDAADADVDADADADADVDVVLLLLRLCDVGADADVA